jgi:predicted peptidase
LRCYVVFGLLIGAALALPRVASADDSWKDLYEVKAYRTADGKKLPYRLLKPDKIEKGKSYPLILFLHGGGENGADNSLQLYIGARDFAKPENRRKHPCFALFPQCPLNSSWGLQDTKVLRDMISKKRSDSLDSALELTDKLLTQLPIDNKRIYVTGLCTGGVGTWNAIERRPNFFAAAIPICRRPSESDDLPRRQAQLLERHLRQSRGHRLAVLADQNEVTQNRRFLPRRITGRAYCTNRSLGLVMMPWKIDRRVASYTVASLAIA